MLHCSSAVALGSSFGTSLEVCYSWRLSGRSLGVHFKRKHQPSQSSPAQPAKSIHTFSSPFYRNILGASCKNLSFLGHFWGGAILGWGHFWIHFWMVFGALQWRYVHFWTSVFRKSASRGFEPTRDFGCPFRAFSQWW